MTGIRLRLRGKRGYRRAGALSPSWLLRASWRGLCEAMQGPRGAGGERARNVSMRVEGGMVWLPLAENSCSPAARSAVAGLAG